MVAQRMAERGVGSNGELARLAGVDPGTVGDFLNGGRWPRMEKRAAIERALGMVVGTIQSVAEGGTVADSSTPERTRPPTKAHALNAVEHLRRELDARLSRYTDEDLIRELRTRALLTAARLHAKGESALGWGVDDDGGDVLTTLPPVGQ